MSEIITVGLDLAKNVFQVHGADSCGRADVSMRGNNDRLRHRDVLHRVL